MLLDPRTWLVGLALLASAYGAGRFQQWRADERNLLASKAEQAAQARNIERQWQNRYDEVRDAKDQDLQRVAAERDRAVRELRKRPARMPETARPACQGATGAELSGRDAEFLAGLAARANVIRAELHACQDREHGKVTPLPQ